MRKQDSLPEKDLIVFDLDGTLTKSKANLTPDMARILAKLLKEKRVAVIGGGRYEQFTKQFVAHLHCPRELLSSLFLFPATATSFYRYKGGWKKIYRKTLLVSEKRKIKAAFNEVFKEARYAEPKKVWGKVIEDRGTQITFSALGQKAPLAAKEKWNEKQDARPKLMKMIQKRLPRYEVRRGGLTSIDVTHKGIDKAYGIRQIEKRLKVQISHMVFIGDALYPGGNDYAAKKTGVFCIAVRGPGDTKKVIGKILEAAK